jgi:hypothetical protein
MKNVMSFTVWNAMHTAGPDALERGSAPGPVDVRERRGENFFMNAGVLHQSAGVGFRLPLAAEKRKAGQTKDSRSRSGHLSRHDARRGIDYPEVGRVACKTDTKERVC